MLPSLLSNPWSDLNTKPYLAPFWYFNICLMANSLWGGVGDDGVINHLSS
jgi:hypothetical protein